MILTNLLSTGFAVTSLATLYFYLRARQNHILAVRLMRETVVEMDAKDPYFNGHIKNVEYLSIELGKAMGIKGKRIKDMKLAIYLTEIGKIRIPDNILFKMEKLTKEELEIVKKHPVVASRMIEGIKGMKNIADIVRAHHERYDGEGYPDNLLGNSIPIEARIINIVDSYTAMISERPYKKSLSENEAIEELKNGKNRQFDGKVVDKFIEILKK